MLDFAGLSGHEAGAGVGGLDQLDAGDLDEQHGQGHEEHFHYC
jgi:hypothetical protein